MKLISQGCLYEMNLLFSEPNLSVVLKELSALKLSRSVYLAGVGRRQLGGCGVTVMVNLLNDHWEVDMKLSVFHGTSY